LTRTKAPTFAPFSSAISLGKYSIAWALNSGGTAASMTSTAAARRNPNRLANPVPAMRGHEQRGTDGPHETSLLIVGGGPHEVTPGINNTKLRFR
jgi:hypothetical protein